MGDAMHAMMPNRGMGGNQAMLDAKVMVPFLERLNYLAKKTGSVSEEAIGAACHEYEREMIPRSFDWVEASGGTNPIVCEPKYPFIEVFSQANSRYSLLILILFSVGFQYGALLSHSRLKTGLRRCSGRLDLGCGLHVYEYHSTTVAGGISLDHCIIYLKQLDTLYLIIFTAPPLSE